MSKETAPASDYVNGKPMLRVTFGYADYVLPWDDGIKVLHLMRDAKKVEMKYDDGGGSRYVLAKNEGVTAQTFTIEQQTQIMMGGAE